MFISTSFFHIEIPIPEGPPVIKPPPPKPKDATENDNADDDEIEFQGYEKLYNLWTYLQMNKNCLIGLLLNISGPL